MNYQQNITSASLRITPNKIAIQLITRWIECAKNAYDVEGIENFGYNELEVENDFVEHLSDSIESLVNDKSPEKKATPGWSFGYVCGHAQGALNVKWSNKYLIEPSKEFEDLMKLKTIIELLKLDSDISRKIEVIYNYFTSHKDKAINEEEGLPDNVISFIKKGKLQNTSRERYRKEFDEYFGKLLMTNYMSLLRAHDFMCCPKLAEYLNERELINIVGKEHFA